MLTLIWIVMLLNNWYDPNAAAFFHTVLLATIFGDTLIPYKYMFSLVPKWRSPYKLPAPLRICRHEWVIREADEITSVATSIGVYNRDAERFCTKCGKYEYYDVHCLGMRPPKYVKTWMKLQKKPRIRIHKDGKIEIV